MILCLGTEKVWQTVQTQCILISVCTLFDIPSAAFGHITVQQHKTLESPWTQWTFTMDSVDIYHGLSRHLPMDSMNSLDNAHGHSGQSPVSPWTKSSETSQTGQCPWIQWTLSMDLRSNTPAGQCPLSPCTFYRCPGSNFMIIATFFFYF